MQNMSCHPVINLPPERNSGGLFGFMNVPYLSSTSSRREEREREAGASRVASMFDK